MFAFNESIKAGLFKKQHIAKNIASGIIVGLVALPLSMAFAIASGAKPENGIYTAIVAGIMVSVFGGTRVQIAGPTGAFIVILSGITAKYGFSGLQVASAMAGVILLVMGAAKFGNIIGFIPYPVTLGFTAGIGVVIFVGQWTDFFGLNVSLAGLHHFHEKLWHLLSAFNTVNIPTVCLGVLGLVIVLYTPPKITRYIPSPLVSMLTVTIIQFFGDFEGVRTIGDAFGTIPSGLPSFTVPHLSGINMTELLGPAITIALLGAIESLLSAVVADGMAGVKHGANQELIGQGLANIVSPFFCGFAATGAIARTATNIKNGGSSPLAGIVHSLTLVLVIIFLAPYASYIPLCSLAAILFVVAYNMSEISHFIELVKTAPKNDVIVLMTTFLLTVFADLVVAVNVGVILASLLFMKRMSDSVKIESSDAECMALRENLFAEATDVSGASGDDREWTGSPNHPVIPSSDPVASVSGDVMVYSINGPFFFGSVKRFERTMKALHTNIRVLILRLENIPFIDATGIKTFDRMLDFFRAEGIRIIVCEANDRVTLRLEQSHVIDHLGRNNFLPDFNSALRAAS